MAVCSPPSHADEFFCGLSPSTISEIAAPSPNEPRFRLPFRSSSDVEETFTKRKCSLDSEDESGNDLDTVPMMLCHSSDEDQPQTSDVHASHPYSDANTDTEMTSNDSTGSYAGSPPSSPSTASPTSGSFKAANNTQTSCCSRPRITTKAPQAALTLPPLSSTLQCDTTSSTNPPATEDSTATTTTPYRFCTSCDTFMGFSPDANLARRKSSILEPIRPPSMAIDAPALPPQQDFPTARKPKLMPQQQQCRPLGPPPAPMPFRGSQRPGVGPMNPPPPLQRKRPLEPPFETNTGAKSIRWDDPRINNHHPRSYQQHTAPPPAPRIQITSPSGAPPSSPTQHHLSHPRRPHPSSPTQHHLSHPRRPHPSIPYYNYPGRARFCACGVPAVVSVEAAGERVWVCGGDGEGMGRRGGRCGFFVRG